MRANEDTIMIKVLGIGIIRLSGDKSKNIVQQCFSKKISSPKTLSVGHFFDTDPNNIIDQVCVVYFESPSSYTGEDCNSMSF